MVQMKYFATNEKLNSSDHDDEIEIFIHCDCHVFDWLLTFMHSTTDKPKLESFSFVPILIASDFLKMEEVIQFCMEYVRLNPSVLSVADLSLLSESMIIQMAREIPSKVLLDVSSFEGSFFTRLFKAKVEVTFCDESAKGNKWKRSNVTKKFQKINISCCKHCGKVFSTSNKTVDNIRCRTNARFSVVGH
uniref:SANT and BTB domain-containing protein n=1 Tax=Proboscia inermis TaxID=420281 RepID=A0A7S0CL10_9STRA|mmetsp:Transcript_6166/g.6369  ORF Transcript_6166/g.6369 Transcript_6166/m.6369 type:complete len:190 (+) Transcript_6166:316-885(+)